MRERVFGIETEYAALYHPRPGARAQPSKLELYQMLEPHLLRTQPTLPRAFSPLRFKWGRFLASGSSLHYEASSESFDQGLIEMASPECKDPLTLLTCERAKDELIEQLGSAVNDDLRALGHRGELRFGKNNVDSQGHSFGSHENYWVEDPLPIARKLLLIPCLTALWAGTALALLWLLAASVLLLAMAVTFPLAVLAAVGLGRALLSLRGRGGLSERLRALGGRVHWRAMWLARARGADAWTRRWVKRLLWVEQPLGWIIGLHAELYRRFHFQRIERQLTAFLVTRIIYAGAGRVALDGGPLLRLAQRPPFLRLLSGIFTSGEARPLFETRDLFFRPWSAFGERRRLHLLIGDANLCDWALTLRVGATALVLEAIEHESEEDWPQLADPLRALSQLNGDLSLRGALPMRDGPAQRALDIQWRYLERARQTVHRASGPVPAWKLRVLRMWQETLEGLERDPDALADRIDWIAKRQLLLREVPNPSDRAALEQRGAELIASPPTAPATPAGGEQLRLRELAFRALRADLRYHELGPRGGHRRLRRAGKVVELVTAEQIARAQREAPADTRAHARGEAIREARGRGGSASWHRVRIGAFHWRWFPDPLSPRTRRF